MLKKVIYITIIKLIIGGYYEESKIFNNTNGNDYYST